MITLVFCGDIQYCPYLGRYTERLDQAGAEYEVLFWNRDGRKIDLPARYYCYEKKSPENLGTRRKLADFYGFRRWVLNRFRAHQPDAAIFLSTLSAVVLYPFIKKIPYLFDIRDYSYEHIPVFRRVEQKIISGSVFTCISSEGFRSFLPEHPYVIAHNFNRHEIPKNTRPYSLHEPIRIVWNGTVRFFAYQKQYLDIFKNDSRFQLIYHGSGTDLELYKRYCQENHIENVEFTGAYDNADKAKLLENADILNNCYGGRSGDELRYAISNRFYDGVMYGIPQIVEPDGFKAGVTLKNSVGLALAPEPGANDRLYHYMQSLDRTAFSEACKKILRQILTEDDLYIESIDQFIRNTMEAGDADSRGNVKN